ncbi:phage tail assembly protein [Mycolicibacterium houstonense]|nr:phage tail assembly protein [Mycolicibacterium houstonense]
MSRVFTLDSMREEADKKYGAPVEIGLSDGSTVTLRNILRLSKPTRESIRKSLDQIQAHNDKPEDDRTTEDAFVLGDAVFHILELAAGADSKKLLKELDGDVIVGIEVLNAWLEDSQVGEASSSES